jgi:KipI family sensor histidine kinase inhibitor
VSAKNRDSPVFVSLGERGLLSSFGTGISEDLSARVRAAAERLRDARVAGVREIVPAYNSVLVVGDPDSLEESGLRALLIEDAGSPPAPPRAGVAHKIPVRYGDDCGPDLAEVAARANLDPGEVVRLHSEITYTVAFLGFLPGFPYMQTVPAEIAVRRHATPQVSVPAGSVGLAARQTGVYPFASPGGWQIIGQTPVTLWDASTPIPAMFNPGDRVKFFASDEARVEVSPASPPTPRTPVFEVLQPGALTTVQDRGRFGYSHLGVGPAGAFDAPAAERANRLAGNSTDAAVLELTLSGPVLRVVRATTIALTGADFRCMVDGTPVPPNLSWFVRAGSIISFLGPRMGLRAYLAVAGGIAVPKVLGSRSTSGHGSFGGQGGGPLRAGSVIGSASPPGEPALLGGILLPPDTDDLPSSGKTTLRYIPVVGRHSAGPEALRLFESETWRVSDRSDRMGLRLAGGSHIASAGGELASFPVIRGAIQLPPDGQPIILGPDHQTTGGYPLLGVVAEIDQQILAQAAPGSEVSFAAIDRDEALALSRACAQAHERALSQLPPPRLGD